MGEHYPEAAIGREISSWCDACKRYTKHVIVRHSEHAGRLGHCLEHEARMLTKEQEKRREKFRIAAQQPRLFDK